MTTACDPIDEAAALIKAGQFEAAEERARAAVLKTPSSIRALMVLSDTLAKQGAFSGAASYAMKGLATEQPLSWEVVALSRTLVACCAQMGLVEVALPYVERLGWVAQTPFPSDQCWPARLYKLLGESDRAMTCLAAVLRNFPADSFVRHELGATRLRLGDADGFDDYAQFMTREFWHLYYAPQMEWVGRYLHKMWNGEPLSGKKIAVMPHGGVGDYFQFARYFPALRELGATERVAALPNERCRLLIESAGPDRCCLSSEIDMEDFDYWVPTFGLWCNLQASYGLMAQTSYLSIEPTSRTDALLSEFRERAGSLPCLGVSWQSDQSDGEEKSLPLSAMLPLFGLSNVHWVVLQRGNARREFCRSGLDRDCSVLDETLSYDETAALMMGLDGIVTICSYTLHLAGALGLRTWFLACRALDARHFNEETRSVLYPSVRLVRQPEVGDWRSAIENLRGQLALL